MKQLRPLLSLILLATLTSSFNPPVKSAEEILKEACKTAKEQEKKVFLIFHASWCGWCHKMDKRMSLPEMKPYFDKNYVIKHIDVMEPAEKKNLETPGGVELLNKYGGGKNGIPFWLIFDENGKLVADSQMRPAGTDLSVPGENIGCPQQPKEIIAFKEVLKKTSSLTDAEIEQVGMVFSKEN